MQAFIAFNLDRHGAKRLATTNIFHRSSQPLLSSHLGTAVT